MARRWKFALGLWTMPPTANALLVLGERPLAWESAALIAGDNRIGKNPKGRAVTGFSFDPFAGGLESNDGFTDRLVGGVAATGGTVSVAAGWVQALDAVQLRLRLLVTDQRLLLVDDSGDQVEMIDPVTGRQGRFRQVRAGVSTPRTAVARVRHRPRPLAAGRVRLEFTDGSSVALMTGVLSWRPARRLVRALRS